SASRRPVPATCSRGSSADCWLRACIRCGRPRPARGSTVRPARSGPVAASSPATCSTRSRSCSRSSSDDERGSAPRRPPVRVGRVNEAAELRAQGHLSAPVLVLAEPPLRQMLDVARLVGVRPTVYTAEAIAAAARAVRDAGRATPLPVHLKIDTGMHRVGAAPEAARHLAEVIVQHEELELEGLWTHLAASEDPAHDDYTARQLSTFEMVRADLRDAGIAPP